MSDPTRLVAESYDRIAERYVAWAAGVRIEERARYVARLVEVLPRGAAVLELGCGAGGPTTSALARRFQVTGVDVSRRSIELARRNVPGARFIAKDMTGVEFASSSFDAIVAFYSIIHVPREEHPALFARICGWLRPGGLFLATLPADAVAAGYEPDWLGVPMYWSGFAPATTRGLIEQAGLSITADALETADEGGRAISFWWVEARRPSAGVSGAAVDQTASP